MRWIIALAFIGASSQAFASGGISCLTENAPAQIEVSAGVTHGMGSPIFQLAATAEVSDAGVAEDLRKSSFAKDNLSQYWLDDKDLKLLLYRERDGDGAFGSVELLITTKPVGDDVGYDGNFKLTISDMGTEGSGEGKTSVFEGKISCSVE